MNNILTARAGTSANGILQAHSPAVGTLQLLVKRGQLVYPGDTIAHIVVLNKRYDIVASAELVGTVLELFAHTNKALQFDDILFSIDHGQERTQSVKNKIIVAAENTISSPLSGIFYRSASPLDPPFVSEGQLINPGAAIGLVEAMKVFNTIEYTGKSPIILERILVADGESVESGQQLFIFGASSS